MQKNNNILVLARKAYSRIFRPKSNFGTIHNGFDYTGQLSSDLIKQTLSNIQPAMICRFGSGELDCAISYLNTKRGFKKYIDYITGAINIFWWDEAIFEGSFYNNGLFPLTYSTFCRFGELMIEDAKSVDILGSWLKQESFFKNELKSAKKVMLADLEPYYHGDPWSEVLEGKTVLVIHPFTESIKNQYQKKELLFQDKRVLPEFNLKTLKAVQSIANNETGFKDWFEAFNYMKDQINNIDFDIAIIGCGAYGFPLAAHVKRIGKKAVHLGGATQTLFGIVGKRWEENAVAKLINEHWVRPLPSEIPNNADAIEGGCYW